jgi:hypothetical protein
MHDTQEHRLAFLVPRREPAELLGLREQSLHSGDQRLFLKEILRVRRACPIFAIKPNQNTERQTGFAKSFTPIDIALPTFHDLESYPSLPALQHGRANLLLFVRF